MSCDSPRQLYLTTYRVALMQDFVKLRRVFLGPLYEAINTLSATLQELGKEIVGQIEWEID